MGTEEILGRPTRSVSKKFPNLERGNCPPSVRFYCESFQDRTAQIATRGFEWHGKAIWNLDGHRHTDSMRQLFLGAPDGSRGRSPSHQRPRVW